MNRRSATLGMLALGLAPLAGHAQRPTGIARIGFLGSGFASGGASRVQALQEGLRSLGYVQGKNVSLEFRWADERYEQLPVLAAQLVNLKPDVIVVTGTTAARAAKAATATIPIVMGAVGDAVSAGLVTSLARPGGNITGSTFFALELYGKRLEILKEVVPHAKRMAFLVNPDNPASTTASAIAENLSKLLKVELDLIAVRGAGEFDRAFSAMVKKRVDAVSVQDNTLFRGHAGALAKLAVTHRLPMASGPELARAGGLVGFGANLDELHRRAAYFVDRILKGAKPADLPVEQPTRFEFVINRKTAALLGISLPPTFLLRADQVIE